MAAAQIAERADFPLPQTAPLLAEIGRGLSELSGLPVERHDEPDLRLWYGIGLQLGTPVSQSKAGLRMKVIRGEGTGIGEVHGRLRDADGATFLSSAAHTVSSGLLRCHTDRTDVAQSAEDRGRAGC